MAGEQNVVGHTPGPWELYANTVTVGNCKGNDVRAECDPYGRVCRDASMADARLIAAAPDMLVALQAIANHQEFVGGSMSRLSATWKIASDAIAKATGGTNA